MAEYWTGKKWVSDEGKSVADLIGVPNIQKGARRGANVLYNYSTRYGKRHLQRHRTNT